MMFSPRVIIILRLIDSLMIYSGIINNTHLSQFDFITNLILSFTAVCSLMNFLNFQLLIFHRNIN